MLLQQLFWVRNVWLCFVLVLLLVTETSIIEIVDALCLNGDEEDK